jgi:hypothetical protein
MTFDEARQRLSRSEVRQLERQILQSVLDDKEGLERAGTGSTAPEKEEEKTAE